MGKHIIVGHSPGRFDTETGFLNDRLAGAGILRRLAEASNTIVAKHKKVVQCRSQDIFSIAAGSGSNHSPWKFYFRTGPNAHGLRLYAGVCDTDYASVSNPRIEFDLRDTSGSTVDDKTVYYNGRNEHSSPEEVLDRTALFTPLLTGLAANTEYYLTMSVRGGARLVYLTAVEESPPSADDSVAGVTDPSKFVLDAPIYDAQIQDLVDAAIGAWKWNGAHLLTWNPDYVSGSTSSIDLPVATYGSYTNVLDATSTTVSANTPGFTLASQYHTRTRNNSTGARVVIAVNATRTVGSGNLAVRLNDGTNQITLSGITTGGTGSWYTGTGVLPSQIAKWDIQALVSAGTFRLEAVCLFHHET